MPARLIGDVPLSGAERARRHREGRRTKLARLAELEAENEDLRAKYYAQHRAFAGASHDLGNVERRLALAEATVTLLKHENALHIREVAQLREFLSVAQEAADLAMRLPRAFK